MNDGITNVAGIEIPSTDPAFLAVVGIHIMLGLACVVTGAIAMLSQKRPGRHPQYGTILFLVFSWAISNRDRLGGRALGRGLPPVYSWRAIICGGVSGTPSPAAALA